MWGGLIIVSSAAVSLLRYFWNEKGGKMQNVGKPEINLILAKNKLRAIASVLENILLLGVFVCCKTLTIT